jgi:hypothetical protein
MFFKWKQNKEQQEKIIHDLRVLEHLVKNGDHKHNDLLKDLSRLHQQLLIKNQIPFVKNSKTIIDLALSISESIYHLDEPSLFEAVKLKLSLLVDIKSVNQNLPEILEKGIDTIKKLSSATPEKKKLLSFKDKKPSPIKIPRVIVRDARIQEIEILNRS